MASIKLSVTHLGRLARKYDTAALKTIKRSVDRWVKADAARGIQTIHVALDDATTMKKLGVPALKGSVTPNKVKRTIDLLWRKLAPDYLVIFGAADVIPYFEVDNPSYDPQGDDDLLVPTDNPYACSKGFSRSRRSSYLLPDRAVGRIPDMVGDGSPSWFTTYLRASAAARPKHPSKYRNAYASCCQQWKEAGQHATRAIGEATSQLLVSPPQKDTSPLHRTRLKSLLHMVKCHGAQLDPRFYGQKGNSYPVSFDSNSLKTRLRPNTVAAAMCCYGAQVYSPNDPAAQVPGQWPVASTYLRKGGLGMAGSTMIAWVGGEVMMCADWIVTGFLKAVQQGASLGRALLESKQDYVAWIGQQGWVPDLADEKTLIEYVLLGDPSLHPMLPATTAASTSGGAVAAGFLGAAAHSPLVSSERRARRIVRADLATTMRKALPTRSAVRKVDTKGAKSAFKAVRALMGKDLAGWNMKESKALVHQVVTPFTAKAPSGARMLAAAVGASVPTQRQAVEYYWSGRKESKGHRQIRLVKVETDTKGNVLRTTLRQSS